MNLCLVMQPLWLALLPLWLASIYTCRACMSPCVALARLGVFRCVYVSYLPPPRARVRLGALVAACGAGSCAREAGGPAQACPSCHAYRLRGRGVARHSRPGDPWMQSHTFCISVHVFRTCVSIAWMVHCYFCIPCSMAWTVTLVSSVVFMAVRLALVYMGARLGA